MKPYESDYPIASNIAAITGLAWSKSYLSVVVSGRPVPGQDRELGRGGNRVCRTIDTLAVNYSWHLTATLPSSRRIDDTVSQVLYRRFYT